MNRRILLGAIGAAVAVALVLLLVSSTRSSGVKHAAPSEPAGQPAAETRPSPQPRKRLPSPVPVATTEEAQAEGAYREMVREDGTTLRDHRNSSNQEPDLTASPATRMRHARVAPMLIKDMRMALRPIVKRCSTQYAADLGAGARLRAQIGVKISGGVLTVGTLDVSAVNVADKALETCVTEGARTLALPAPGHEDVNHHMITFPFRLPME